VLTEQRKYWLTKLNGKLSRLNLPTDFDKNEETSFLGNEITFRLSDHEMKMLTQLSIKHNTTLYMNFLAIVSHVLFELTRQRDILVGTPVTGRIHPSLENQVGLYVNYIVLRTKILEVEKLNTFFRNIKETVIGGFENQIYPFPWLVGEVDYEYNPLYNPLFDVLVMEKINEGEITGMNGVSIEWYKQEYILSRYDLCFYINNCGSYLELSIKYKKELFLESTIEKIKYLFLGTLFTFSND
jgi:non-ribosomal peptide synthetase component F